MVIPKEKVMLTIDKQDFGGPPVSIQLNICQFYCFWCFCAGYGETIKRSFNLSQKWSIAFTTKFPTAKPAGQQIWYRDVVLTVMQNSQTNSNGYGFSRNGIHNLSQINAIIVG